MKEMHYFSYFTEFLFEDWKFFVRDESTKIRSHHRKPKSNIFPLNILCVFLILTLEKDGARGLKMHNLFWKA